MSEKQKNSEILLAVFAIAIVDDLIHFYLQILLMNESRLFSVKVFTVWAILSLPGNFVTLYFSYADEQPKSQNISLLNGKNFQSI